MANEQDWSFPQLGEIACNVSEPFDFAGRDNVIFVNTGDVLSGKFLHSDLSSTVSLPGQAKKAIQTHDILLSEIRPANHRFAYVDIEDTSDYVVSTKFMVVRPIKGFSSRYLYHVLTSKTMLRELQRIAESRSGTFPQITFDSISYLPIAVPPKNLIGPITAFFDALDAKIELNRRISQTLESLARAIFKSWFVDFDPVRAKVDGQQPPGLDHATAALFPDGFEHQNGELVPIGWTVEPVGEVIQAVGGSTPSTKDPTYWEGGTHYWATPKDLSGRSSPILLDTERQITDAGVAKISSGLLPPGTVLLSSRAPVGYLAISRIPIAINQGFIAIICSERASNYFMLQWCYHNMDQIKGRASGTTFQEVSKKNFRPIPMLLPSSELVAAFTECVSPIYSQMTNNLRESQTLTDMRDTLLPRLLSGEVRVDDANRTVEAVL